MADREVFQTRHDWDGDGPLSGTVVHAVAAVSGLEPTELEPLGSVVDADALDALFAPTRGGAARDEGHVTFHLGNCRVTVHADGHIEVLPEG